MPASPIFLPTFIRRSLERLRNAPDSSRCTHSVSFPLSSLIRPLNFVHKSFPSPLSALLIDSRYGFRREVTVQKILQIKPPYKGLRIQDGEEAKEADRRKGMILNKSTCSIGALRYRRFTAIERGCERPSNRNPSGFEKELLFINIAIITPNRWRFSPKQNESKAGLFKNSVDPMIRPLPT